MHAVTDVVTVNQWPVLYRNCRCVTVEPQPDFAFRAANTRGRGALGTSKGRYYTSP